MKVREIGLVWLAVWAGPAAYGQTRPGDSSSLLSRGALVQNRFMELNRMTINLGDWSNQAEIIRGSMQSVWQHNDWNSEADRFALRVGQEVTNIPPWQFSDRINRFKDLVRERYQFSDDQLTKMERLIYSEAAAFAWRHADEIYTQSKEFLETRAAGKPFTPEQVARWSEMAKPMMEDAEMRMEAATEEVRKWCNDDQRRILDVDLESMRKRQSSLLEGLESWAQGKWSPQDWGLERDPLHQQLIQQEQASNAAAAKAEPPSYDPRDESTWDRYVRKFVRQYHLDHGQILTAYSVLRELKGRAAAVRERALGGAAEGDAGADRLAQAEAEITAMFDELKSRLFMIPTSRQLAEGAEN